MMMTSASACFEMACCNTVLPAPNGPGMKARTAFGQRVEGVDRTHARLHDAVGARFLDIAADRLLHGPALHHRHLVVAAFGVGQDGHRVGDLVRARRGDLLTV